jgi:hypothetical protein
MAQLVATGKTEDAALETVIAKELRVPKSIAKQIALQLKEAE